MVCAFISENHHEQLYKLVKCFKHIISTIFSRICSINPSINNDPMTSMRSQRQHHHRPPRPGDRCPRGRSLR